MDAQITTSMNQHHEFRTSTCIQEVSVFIGYTELSFWGNSPVCDVTHVKIFRNSFNNKAVQILSMKMENLDQTVLN